MFSRTAKKERSSLNYNNIDTLVRKMKFYLQKKQYNIIIVNTIGITSLDINSLLSNKQ